jgi:tRNA threonylcarbamoyladenosine biosynthesis protein TsaE
MIYSFDQINQVAKMLLNLAFEKNCLTIALKGEMGSGKTTLAKAIFFEIGCEQTSSPTFGLVNSYPFGDTFVYHFDFYRINKVQELYDIGAGEMLSQSFSVVEWPELAAEVLPENTLWVELTPAEGQSRNLSWSFSAKQ